MHLPEPTLDELLNEPMIRDVMAADHYSADDVRLLLWEASARSNTGDYWKRSATRALGNRSALIN